LRPTPSVSMSSSMWGLTPAAMRTRVLLGLLSKVTMLRT
jgi:hypothetical protein